MLLSLTYIQVPELHLITANAILQTILQLRLRVATNRALDQPVRVGLRRIHLGILAGVLQALVPAQVCDKQWVSRNSRRGDINQTNYVPTSK